MGEGGFSTVYKARQYFYDRTPPTSRTLPTLPYKIVAIKVVSLFPQARDRVRSDPADEVKYLKRCASSHIIPLLDVFESPEEDGTCSLVFPFIPTTLYSIQQQQRQQQGTLHESQVKGITRQLLEALNVMHERGVMHRDIKPSNIVINSEGCLFLIDLGRAREIMKGDDGNDNIYDDNDNDDDEYTRPLTPQVQQRQYRAPEILFGGTYGCSADIWALGALVFEALTGFSLVGGGSDIELMCSFCETFGSPESSWGGVNECSDWGKIEIECSHPPLLPSLLSALSRTAQSFILDALTINPKKRPSAHILLKHKWLSTGVPESLL